jgi:hypothetical protein
MTQELYDKLCKKYPKIFEGRKKSIKQSLIPFGFECGDGWYNIIDILCSNLQWNTDKNSKDYVIKNKLLRKLIPFLRNIFMKIPGKYNLKRHRQINPMVYIRSFLVGFLDELRRRQEFIYIESDRYPQIIATQVKEKFGGLRFYVKGASEQQHAVISLIESLSYRVCEKCGSMKDIGRTDGWISTLCKECHDPESNWKLLTDENEEKS